MLEHIEFLKSLGHAIPLGVEDCKTVQEINRLVFSAEPKKRVLDYDIAVISAHYAGVALTRKRVLESKLEGLSIEIESLLVRISEKQAEAASLGSLEVQDFNWKKLDALAELPYFTFSFSGLEIIGVTPDVWLFEKNELAGIDLKVCFGKFSVHMGMHDFSVRIKPLENNVSVGSHYHPHVGNAGTPCLGEFQEEWSKLSATQNYRRAFEILAQILTTYNAASPYRSLQKFDDAAKNVTRCSECEETDCTCSRCEHCERITSDCECLFCENCEEITDACECVRCDRCENMVSALFCTTCDACESCGHAEGCGRE